MSQNIDIVRYTLALLHYSKYDYLILDNPTNASSKTLSTQNINDIELYIDNTYHLLSEYNYVTTTEEGIIVRTYTIPITTKSFVFFDPYQN